MPDSQDKKTHVLGAGGIGLFLQFLLQEKLGSSLIATERSWQQLQAHKLLVTGQRQGELAVSCRTDDGGNFSRSCRAIFIATKAHQLEPVLQELKTKLPADAVVMLCQNGIGVYEMARKLLPDNPLIRMHCWMGVQRITLSHIHVSGVSRFDLSSDTNNSAIADYWRDIFIRCGVDATTGSDPVHAEWQKALVNVAANGLCSIINQPNGAILDYPEIERLAAAIMDETIHIAALAGIKLTQKDQETAFQGLEITRDNINSTLQDLRAGRHTELAYLNVAVARLARQQGQTAPLNEAIVDLVTFLERPCR